MNIGLGLRLSGHGTQSKIVLSVYSSNPKIGIYYTSSQGQSPSLSIHAVFNPGLSIFAVNCSDSLNKVHSP